MLLSHLSGSATAGFAALATVVVNNLPAASMLAARTPGHPFQLLVGLNLGPNLCVTGSAGLAALAAVGARRRRPAVIGEGQPPRRGRGTDSPWRSPWERSLSPGGY